MKIVQVPYYEVRLYIGSREGYHGEPFGKRQLMKAIRSYQEHGSVSVRITKCTYQVGDWDENGWEVAAIDYPRFPKGIQFLNDWASGLAAHLLENLHQNRITVCAPDYSRTYEADNAEEKTT